MVNLKKLWKKHSLFLVFGAIAGLVLGLVFNVVDVSNPSLLRLIELDKEYYSFLLPGVGAVIGIVANYFKER